MKLYFQNSQGERRLIGEPRTAEESHKIMHNFCADRNFKIYYIRSWVTKSGEKYYDVGSHTEYFIEVNDDKEDVAHE